MSENNKHECDNCGRIVDFDEVAYLGSEYQVCSPFMKLDCICNKCYYEKINTERQT